MPIRIAIVNDYEIVVAGVAAVLAPYADRVEVIELDAQETPVSDVDVVLYDTFGQPQGEAMDVVRLIGDTGARVVVFTWNTDAPVVAQARAAGAAGYLSKGLSADQLVSAIERVHAGEQVSPETDEMPVGDTVGRWPGQEFGLSARESEVLALITQGYTNHDLAERAFIGVNTVKTHIRSLYRKIGVESRSQAIVWGYAHGFEPDRSRQVGPRP